MSTSLKQPAEWAARPPTFIPKEPTLVNYVAQFIQLPSEIYGPWYAAYGSAYPFMLNTLAAVSITLLLTAGLTIIIPYIAKTSLIVQKLSPSLVLIDAIPRISVAIGFLWIFTLIPSLYDTPAGLSLAYTAESIGFSIIAVKLFYDRIPRDVEESIQLAGYGKLRSFLVNIFSNCRTGITLALFLAFVTAWQDFTYALLLTNFSSTITVRLASFTHEVGELFGLKAALATITSIPLLLLTLLMWSRLREYYSEVHLYEFSKTTSTKTTGWSEKIKTLFFLVIYIFFLILPVVAVASYWVLLPSESSPISRLELQLYKYVDVLTDSFFHLSLLRTWAILVLTLVSAIGVSLFVAYLVVFHGGTWTKIAVPFLTVPLFIPPIVAGYAFRIIFYPAGPVESFFEMLGLPTVRWLADPSASLLAVTIANIWVSLPLAVMVIYGGVRTLAKEAVIGSLVLGASRVHTFFSIVVPQIKRYILLAVLLVCIHTFEIFDIPFIMTFGGPGSATTTVSFFIYSEAFRVADIPKVSALAVVVGSIQMVFALLLLWIIRKD
ncbi:MAG: ABC transporter permease subunit [Candidatus Caldarchaeum sp.]|nr:ABC transporter permease subunit [Candidatus Caldarchaeum sp.]